MLMDTKSRPTTKQKNWKYTNVASIYSKHNIARTLKETPNTKHYLENFKLDTQENVVII